MKGADWRGRCKASLVQFRVYILVKRRQGRVCMYPVFGEYLLRARLWERWLHLLHSCEWPLGVRVLVRTMPCHIIHDLVYGLWLLGFICLVLFCFFFVFLSKKYFILIQVIFPLGNKSNSTWEHLIQSSSLPRSSPQSRSHLVTVSLILVVIASVTLSAVYIPLFLDTSTLDTLC